jgi:hypothetical protein
MARIAVTRGLSRPAGDSFRNRLPLRSGLFFRQAGAHAFNERFDLFTIEAELFPDAMAFDLAISREAPKRHPRNGEPFSDFLGGQEFLGDGGHRVLILCQAGGLSNSS